MGQKGSEKNDSETNERERETKKTNEEEDFSDDIIIFDVVILGAGMSGVSCAREICFALNDDDEKNARKVALLEANATVGGRCKQTNNIAKWPVELGAEFIHGEVKNPVKDLLAETMRREEDLEEDLDGKKGTPKRMQCSAFEWPDRYAMNTTTTTNNNNNSSSNTEEKDALLYSFSKKSMLVLRDGDECEKNDKDVWKIHQLFDRLPGVSKTRTITTTHDDESEEDEMSSLSALEWLRDVQKCTEREIRVAELIYATDFGASLKDIGMREIMIEKERWENGEQYLVMNGGFNELFRRAFLNAFQRNSNSNSNSNNSPVVNIDVRLNWEVETVEKEDERNLIKVTGRTTTTETSEKKTLYAKKVVVSLPLPIYRPTDDDDSDDKKLSRVTFHPPLSEEKRKALRAVKMGNAVKVLLGFNEKFWPQENLFNVICDHPAPFPEFWVVSDKEKTIYSDEDDIINNKTDDEEESKKEEVRFVITFFVTGDRANAMAKIDPNERIEMAFQQFVWITMRITNDNDDGRKEFDRIREKHLKTSETKAWSEDKFAGGSYTHPSVGCDRKTRDLLAKSEWSDCLFFCGEGTNASVNPCLQGAFETGVRAAKEVLESLKLQ